MDKNTALRQYFGYHAFKEGQEQIIDSVLKGHDVTGIMPTGGGKSLCYQVPALLMPGITLVISPLISLMRDQVMALKKAGVDAAFINSSLSEQQISTVCRRIREAVYKIVYVAPERLEGDAFVSLMRAIDVSLVAVDEAHCISHWGQDFRPSYLKIAGFISKLPKRPVVAAFTATATDEVRQDIVNILKLQDPVCFVTGFDRPNLYFEVLKQRDKNSELRRLIEERCEKSGIIYCATRKSVESVCENLNIMGIQATRYHAGLADGERRINQDDFQFDRKPVMVATNAFGMGVDKSNISYVIHYNMPKSLEAYYQEAGRAGRDGERADCILLFSEGDINTAKFMIQNSGDNEDLSAEERNLIQRQEYKRLNIMTGYCRTTSCLRGYILGYFGQSHGDVCGSCGNCHSAFELKDITEQSRMILSCVKRVRDYLGYHVGITLIMNVLFGSRAKRVTHLKLYELSTYGIMKTSAGVQVRDYINYLVSQGYLTVNAAYETLELTKKSSEVLFGDKRVEMKVRVEQVSVVKSSKKRMAGRAATEPSGALMDALRMTRKRIANMENVPAYIVFSNACLADMVAKRPQTMQEFLKVSGVGEIKAARYGRQFLDEISKFEKGLG